LREQERPDTETSEDLARSVLEGPGMEAPRDEVADRVEEGKAAAGGRLDDLDEVEQAAREAEQVSCPRVVATHQRVFCHSLAFPRTSLGVRPLVQRPV
jgi:hypothetical protein